MKIKPPLIELKVVGKFFGLTAAVVDVSLSFFEGDTVVFIGKNGAGKSTLLSILAGAICPDEGQVIFGQSAPLKIGYLGQHTCMYRDLTLRENLELAFTARGVPESKDLVRKELEAAELLQFADTRIGNCSQGVRRRGALIRAIGGGPKVVILDEPFAHLDLRATKVVFNELIELKQSGTTLVIASHQEQVMEVLADKIILMRKGKVISCLSKTELIGTTMEELLTGGE